MTTQLSTDADAAASREWTTITYSRIDGVAVITMDRPQFANAQNKRMTYDLDEAFARAVGDEAVGAIVLRGAGKHFSSGHDLGTPEKDSGVEDIVRRSSWYGETDLLGGERQYVREQEIYLGMCRRWRELPKPTIAQVHGACIAGGLMLAWVCDLIVASEDAFFSDPTLDLGAPGVEYFAHGHELPSRIAREFLMLGDRMPAARAYELGMVNRLTTRDELEATTMEVARKLAKKPRFAMALTKQAFNLVEDLQGKRVGMDGVFGMHHLAHTHNQALYGSVVKKPD